MHHRVKLAGTGACVLSLMACTVARAQTVDEVIDRYLSARGGLGRIRAVQSMKITRTVTTLGATLKITIYKKRQGLYRSEVTPAGRPTTLRGLGPDGLWEVQGGKLTRHPEAMAVELAELDADIDGMLVDYRQKGHAVELAGRRVEAGVDSYELKVTLKSGAVRHVFLDAASFLERKQVGQISLAPDRKVAVEIRYGDYREVGGLRLPFAVDEERDAMGQTFAFYTDAIELDVALEDALFRLPPDAAR